MALTIRIKQRCEDFSGNSSRGFFPGDLIRKKSPNINPLNPAARIRPACVTP